MQPANPAPAAPLPDARLEEIRAEIARNQRELDEKFPVGTHSKYLAVQKDLLAEVERLRASEARWQAEWEGQAPALTEARADLMAANEEHDKLRNRMAGFSYEADSWQARAEQAEAQRDAARQEAAEAEAEKLAAFEELRQAGRWVPAVERLPELDQRVAVYFADPAGGYATTAFRTVLAGTDAPRWYGHSGSIAPRATEWITHWAALPQAGKEPAP